MGKTRGGKSNVEFRKTEQELQLEKEAAELNSLLRSKEVRKHGVFANSEDLEVKTNKTEELQNEKDVNEVVNRSQDLEIKTNQYEEGHSRNEIYEVVNKFEGHDEIKQETNEVAEESENLEIKIDQHKEP